jgi:hypothetical protein
MISRKTAQKLAKIFRMEFASEEWRGHTTQSYRPSKVYRDKLYDFLFGCSYEAWFCNTAKTLPSPRDVEEWLLKLHTGETQATATPNWSWEQREKLGQEYLHNLSEDILLWHQRDLDDWHKNHYAEHITALKSGLEIDGFIWRDGKLLKPEEDVIDIRHSETVLNGLCQTLGLANQEIAFHHLRLSEEHFHGGKWDDSIANSRKFFECILSEASVVFAARTARPTLTSQQLQQPVAVREYLEREGLLEAKEKEAVGKVYGLLSHTGGHPYMAEKDQARLLRNLALTLSQFVLLRVEGAVKDGVKIKK